MNIRATKTLWHKGWQGLNEPRADRFNLNRRLGTGAFYDIHCYNGTPHPSLAIKIPSPYLRGTPFVGQRVFPAGKDLPGFDHMTRFLEHEAAALAFLTQDSHPNIVGYRGHGEIECAQARPRSTVDDTMKVFYLAMELVRGANLYKIIYNPLRRFSSGNEGLEVPESVSLTLAIAQGLRHIHDKDYVHGDVKPVNVILEALSGRPVLCDLTSARRTGEYLLTERPGSPQMLTLDYTSQHRLFTHPPRRREDLFSLGISFYEMLTGGNPFYDRTTQLFDYQGLGVYIKNLANQNVPREVIELLYRLTGTNGEYGVYEQGIYDHAAEVVEHIQKTPVLRRLATHLT